MALMGFNGILRYFMGLNGRDLLAAISQLKIGKSSRDLSSPNLGFFDRMRIPTYSRKWSTTIVVSHIYIYIHIHIHTYRAYGISSILYLASKPLINLDAHPGSIYVHILPDHQISNLSQCSNVQNLTLEAPSCNLVYNPHELFTRNPEFTALESNFDNDLGHDIVI